MANTDAPFGLRALRNLIGKTPALREYTADAGGSHIYEGALVMVIPGSGTDDETIDVWAAASANPILGVAAQARLTTDTERTLAVYVDPDQEYEIQVDDGTFTHESDYVGSYLTLTGVGSGDSDTNQSIMEVDGSVAGAAASTTTAVVLGVSKSRDPENSDYSSANPNVVVTISAKQHVFGGDIGVA